jgi:general secretion pathway protein J
MRRSRAGLGEAGFTLMEAMAAVAAMGAIVLAIAMIAGQWLPNWRRGFVELQRADLLSLGLERIAADVAAAEYVSASGAAEEPLFDGERRSVTFVRSAIGPDAPSRLEIVRIAETVDDGGFAIVRTRAPFIPSAPGAPASKFADPVVLVHAPFRLSFAYAGPDRNWTETWRGGKRLPDSMRVTVRDAEGGRVLAASTAVALRVTARAVSESAKDANAQAAATTPAPAPSAPVR